MTHAKSILTPLVALVIGINALLAAAAPPPGLVTCSNLTLEVNGAPVWVENLTKACPPDAPDWFRYNTSNNLAVNIAAFTCTNASTLSLHLEKPVKTLTVRPKSLRIAVTGKDRDWSLALARPVQTLRGG